MVSLTKMRARPLIVVALVLAAIVAVVVLLRGFPQLRAAAFWQSQASPGGLSAGHAFLEQDCAQCHTSIRGAEPAKCIVCHANNLALLKRQPTSFHANVPACADCHREHAGTYPVRTVMDHRALAAIGQRRTELPAEAGESPSFYWRFRTWLRRVNSPMKGGVENPHLTPGEMTLDCRNCHATRDVHVGLFGRDCAQCHATVQWTLPEFRHPSPRSLDCVQCHLAPPSHYMEHFRMISMRIAGEHSARVEQCYLCHQTTAWNDIRSVGYYKHH